jgi:endonuclease YncB( thermonuclease family)
MMLASCANVAHAEKVSYIELQFVRVYDGDTIDVSYQALPEPLNKLRIRIPGIDTPELGSKARCDKEAKGAEAAREFLDSTLSGVNVIRLYSPRWDKYGGRVLGKVYVTIAGKDVLLSDLMIKKGFARAYDGKSARQSWCD